MIIAAIIFAVFYFIARGVRSVVRRMTRNRQTADVGLVLGRLAQWTIVLLGLLVALTIVAPSVKPVDLLSLLGIGGVAIGFAFKDILQNFVAGILILLRHPFRVGDQVIFASYEGYGIGGQTARDMLDGVDTDVLADHLSLTIWQTGVNDALEEVPIEQFEETLRQGIDVLHGNNVDVILMDMQYYPASARIPYYEDYLKAMREVAEEKRVALFRRYDIMKYWIDSGQFRIDDEVLLHDQFHLADPSYSCLAADWRTCWRPDPIK